MLYHGDHYLVLNTVSARRTAAPYRVRIVTCHAATIRRDG